MIKLPCAITKTKMAYLHKHIGPVLLWLPHKVLSASPLRNANFVCWILEKSPRSRTNIVVKRRRKLCHQNQNSICLLNLNLDPMHFLCKVSEIRWSKYSWKCHGSIAYCAKICKRVLPSLLQNLFHWHNTQSFSGWNV